MLVSQLNYLLAPADISCVEKIIEADGRFRFLHQPLFSPTVSLAQSVPPAKDGQWGDRFMVIVRPGDEERIGLHFIETCRYFLPDTMNGYAVEYGRCFFDGKILGRNRMCFFSTYSDSSGNYRYKDADFIKDVRSLFRKVKRILSPIENGWYAGNEALELRKQGLKFDFNKH
jgi:hypothetical protein